MSDPLVQFYGKVRDSLIAAEDHIGVERGAIINLPHENSFVFILGVYGVIEPILNDLLCDQILTFRTKHKPFQDAQEGARKFVQKQNYTNKTALLFDIGIIGRSERDFIDTLALIRNRFGHNVKNLRKSAAELLQEEETRSGKSYFTLISGFRKSDPGFNRLQSDNVLKYIVIAQLAAFLSSALHTLQPPSASKFPGLLSSLGGLGGLGGFRGEAEARGMPRNGLLHGILAHPAVGNRTDDEVEKSVKAARGRDTPSSD